MHLLVAAGLISGALFSHASDLLVKEGETIAFMGDSITAAGKKKDGYITLVMEALNHEGLNLSSIPAGISGHKSNQMLERLDRDVISKKPDWMTLSCGVNDVWHFQLKLGARSFQGVELPDYKKNITEILDKCEAAGIKVMILTSTMIGEDPDRELNRNLIPYNDFLREIAGQRKLPMADLSRLMHDTLKSMPDEEGKARMFGEKDYQRNIKNKLTSDGCHMNALGNRMMAKGILRAFGLSEDKISEAEKRWANSTE
jgi:lysophospholipase L1-like esterase